MKKPTWWVGVSLGMAAGLGGVILADHGSTPADAATFQVTPAQLQINQRISQAAVRRSNESLDLLDPIRKSGPSDTAPGWGTAQIKDGAVTVAKLDTGARERLPRWAVVASTSGNLVRAQGATASAKLAAAGEYTVTFDRDVSACSVGATIADPGTTAPADGVVVAWRSATDPKTVTVRTSDITGGAFTPTNTLPFQVSVLC